ncbi:MAG: hypothetical protein ACRBCT_08285 [Alphaproteobacteria bacterium]
MHRYMLIGLVGLVLVGALLTILQMWTGLIGWDVFIKLIITLGILVLVLGFLMVIKADLGEHKRLKDENYLD